MPAEPRRLWFSSIFPRATWTGAETFLRAADAEDKGAAPALSLDFLFALCSILGMKDRQVPPPEFTPVPVRYRQDGWTPGRQYGYLVALAECGSAKRAAEAVGMTAQSATRLGRRPEAAAYHRLCEAACQLAKQRCAQERLARLRAARRGKFS
jgi:hypothetical protein